MPQKCARKFGCTFGAFHFWGEMFCDTSNLCFFRTQVTQAENVLLYVVLYIAYDRQLDSKGINAIFAFYPVFSFVCFYDAFGNGEPQSIAACPFPGSIGPIETFKNVLALLGWQRKSQQTVRIVCCNGAWGQGNILALTSCSFIYAQRSQLKTQLPTLRSTYAICKSIKTKCFDRQRWT